MTGIGSSSEPAVGRTTAKPDGRIRQVIIAAVLALLLVVGVVIAQVIRDDGATKTGSTSPSVAATATTPKTPASATADPTSALSAAEALDQLFTLPPSDGFEGGVSSVPFNAEVQPDGAWELYLLVC